MTPDPVLAEIIAAVGLTRTDHGAGRDKLQALWSRIADHPDPVHECVLAHYMADIQDDPAEELAWDIRSLEAAGRCTEADNGCLPTGSIAGFMPSIHANLAEDYLKLGDPVRAREHLAAAREYEGVLADDAYGQLVRRGIERIARTLDASAKTDNAP